MRAGKAERRLASLTVATLTDQEPSVIVLRGPAFGGAHVVELRPRGMDPASSDYAGASRRGWRLVVDGREGGNLAVGAVARILGMLK